MAHSKPNHPPAPVCPEPKAEPNIYQVISDHPMTWVLTVALFLAFLAYIITKFKVTWKGYRPHFTSRSELKIQTEIAEQQKKIEELEADLKAYRPFDFYKKTENGEYIGYSVAKSPYVEFWADGNWSSQEYHIELVTFEKLWGEEDAIIIYGKNPNAPSDLYAILEKKAKELPSLTIYCEYKLGEALIKFFKGFETVKVIVRS